MQVQVKNGIVYEGVLKTFSPKVSLYAIFSIIFSAFSISRENNAMPEQCLRSHFILDK